MPYTLRSTLKTLHATQGYPSVSVLARTYRTPPDNQQDPIVVKNLVREARERLLAEFDARSAESVLNQLDIAAGVVDYNYTQEGLALFVNAEMGKVVYLPIPVESRVEINETFATRDLIKALNRSPRYYALVLSAQPSRLYEGLRDNLTELKGDGFPATMNRPGGSVAIPSDPGQDKGRYLDEQQRHFLREVDNALGVYLTHEPLPVVVIGTENLLSAFLANTNHGDAVLATHGGSHDATPPHELGKLAWPVVEAARTEQRLALLDQLAEAGGASKSASGLGEVWRFAKEGRGAVLLVEEGYSAPGRADETGMHLTPVEESERSESGVIDDAVDVIAETVFEMGGRVAFVPDGSLAVNQRIALILRY
jgi:hypothetical protein